MPLYKYPLDLSCEQPQSLSLPAGAKILSMQVQHGRPCLWALVEPNAASECWTVRIVGTGAPFELQPHEAYLGTVQMNDGALVWHAFGGKAPQGQGTEAQQSTGAQGTSMTLGPSPGSAARGSGGDEKLRRRERNPR